MNKLDLKLAILANVTDAERKPYISLSVYIPNKKKAGGSQEEIAGAVTKVDMFRQEVILNTGTKSGGKKIPIENICDMHGALVDYLDDEFL